MTDKTKVAPLTMRQFVQERDKHISEIADRQNQILEIEYRAKKLIILKGRIEMLTINWRIVNRYYRK